ncbi:DMT family transporter [Aidingimonas halophila]|uniref:EamA domain-containing membrane protein RarD n=1 Tax=Aidingimonas halophila TaxID=574349 RepID=A0A1H3E8W8_9GAMM|nr:DMT family transporter [Aidingimonas halophila]GHC33890.1 multidrug DMT transporter [Aidingimonas halophila]SDX75202.1 EamA domain-containing membrane protein RarD [Aidingimonas halophila]
MRAFVPYMLLLLTAIIFSGNILVGKALSDLPPLTISFGRVFIALLFMIPLGWRQAVKARQAFRQHWGVLLGLALSGVTFFNALIYTSLQYTSATNVAILESTIPVVTILFSFLLLGERYRPIQWLGVAMSLAGAIAVIVMADSADAGLASVNIGDGIMAVAVLMWVGYSLLVKDHLSTFPRFGGLLVMLVIANLALAPIALWENLALGTPPALDTGHWLGLLYLGIFPSVVALLCYTRAIGDVGPTQAAVFLNLLPIFTMLGAWWLLGDRILPAQIVGSIVVIAGVVLTTRERRSAHVESESVS